MYEYKYGYEYATIIRAARKLKEFNEGDEHSVEATEAKFNEIASMLKGTTVYAVRDIADIEFNKYAITGSNASLLLGNAVENLIRYELVPGSETTEEDE